MRSVSQQYGRKEIEPFFDGSAQSDDFRVISSFASLFKSSKKYSNSCPTEAAAPGPAPTEAPSSRGSSLIPKGD